MGTACSKSLGLSPHKIRGCLPLEAQFWWVPGEPLPGAPSSPRGDMAVEPGALPGARGSPSFPGFSARVCCILT